MKTKAILRVGSVGLMALASSGVLGANITIFDGQGYNGSAYVPLDASNTKAGNYFNGAGTSSAGKATRELAGQDAATFWNVSRDDDQETEPGTPNNNIIASQMWDLEAFVTTGGKNLQIIGGYDILSPTHTTTETGASGDIFIDVTGDAKFGPAAVGTGSGGGGVSNNLLGYDYAIVFSRNSNGTLSGAKTYNVVKLSGSSIDASVYYSQNQESNPWKYASGGQIIQTDIPYTVQSGLTDAQTGFLGGTHYALDFSLNFLTDPEFANATLHYTIMCGNDNLMGHVPDGGLTLAMLGMGIGGLALVGRRLRK